MLKKILKSLFVLLIFQNSMMALTIKTLNFEESARYEKKRFSSDAKKLYLKVSLIFVASRSSMAPRRDRVIIADNNLTYLKHHWSDRRIEPDKIYHIKLSDKEVEEIIKFIKEKKLDNDVREFEKSFAPLSVHGDKIRYHSNLKLYMKIGSKKVYTVIGGAYEVRKGNKLKVIKNKKYIDDLLLLIAKLKGLKHYKITDKK